jgi:hypothetical protein
MPRSRRWQMKLLEMAANSHPKNVTPYLVGICEIVFLDFAVYRLYNGV